MKLKYEKREGDNGIEREHETKVSKHTQINGHFLNSLKID